VTSFTESVKIKMILIYFSHKYLFLISTLAKLLEIIQKLKVIMKKMLPIVGDLVGDRAQKA